MATQLVYDGSAKDTVYEPGKHRIGDNGKPIKRSYATKGKLEYVPIDTYELWGVKFPFGVEVEVTPDLIARGIVEKAEALGCFEVKGKPSAPRKGRRARAQAEE